MFSGLSDCIWNSSTSSCPSSYSKWSISAKEVFLSNNVVKILGVYGYNYWNLPDSFGNFSKSAVEKDKLSKPPSDNLGDQCSWVHSGYYMLDRDIPIYSKEI